MITVSVLGLKKSGKTTSCEALIREFKSRGLRVGAVKSMHHARMTIDTKGKDTWRHRQAGADFVVSLSKGEMGYIEAVMGRATLREARRHFPKGTGILVCEGVEGLGSEAIKVVALKSAALLPETLKIRGLGRGKNVLALTGIFTNATKKHSKYPVFNCTVKRDAKALADLILEGGML
ncbi:MAG: molybdopterin-guanine dinucleotide biosynthesis protein B [Methanobacteriota archaeon]